MSYIDTELAQLDIWEGDILHAYLDSDAPPNVTVGKGYLVASISAMQALPWKLKGSLAPASPAQVVQEWNRVRALPGSMSAPRYDAPQALVLTQSDVDLLTEKMLLGFDADLRVDFDGYDTLPDSVKVVLLDLEWNLGDVKLRGSYPRFDAGVDARNWPVAAAECGTDTNDPAFNLRNAWRRKLILEAVGG